MNVSLRRPSLCRRRARAKRRRAGGVYVEAVVVIVTLVLFLAGSLFFRDLYAKKISTMQKARAAAWVASNECPGMDVIQVGKLLWNKAKAGVPIAVAKGIHAGGDEQSAIESFDPTAEAVGETLILEPGTEKAYTAGSRARQPLIPVQVRLSTGTLFACNEVPRRYDDLLSVFLADPPIMDIFP